ncbi:sensor histidine kinase [Pseudonocardia sp. N23]|uniref:sensor histidine kinase n=1 Tax=Pseudonocardia sp. N23 TaxID=1987376 RepID=UPI000C033742|nr:histidine kinase [Pseudonocardia sp. N23]GAY10589.1 two-component system sensor kinase [Pseudonocardia sp. N23]
MRWLRWVVAPLVDGVTWRRALHLLLGAVVALPYGALAWLFALALASGGMDVFSSVVLLALASAAAVGVAFAPGVRALEVTAARALLDADVPDPGPPTWPARRRAAGWLALVAATGTVAMLVTLVVVPSAIALVAAPWRATTPLPTGLAAAWCPVAGPALPVLLAHAVSATGRALGRVAPRLLGPDRRERLLAELAAAQRVADDLAVRNRLARELHDSVGHALTVTTLQAAAAARVLDSDPEFARRALDAIADAGRGALDDLDHVLGLLREDRDGVPGDAAPRAPAADLTDLHRLVDGARTAGVDVHVDVAGDLGAVPAVVSREAYRIVQESLTNALRHAGPVPVTVRLDAGAGLLALDVENPVGRQGSRAGGGRGVAGMAERVRVLRGELVAGRDDGAWRVAARLPWPAAPGSAP